MVGPRSASRISGALLNAAHLAVSSSEDVMPLSRCRAAELIYLFGGTHLVRPMRMMSEVTIIMSLSGNRTEPFLLSILNSSWQKMLESDPRNYPEGRNCLDELARKMTATPSVTTMPTWSPARAASASLCASHLIMRPRSSAR